MAAEGVLSPDAKAGRLDAIADEIEGARRLAVAGRMALDKTHANSTDQDEAEGLCELLYAIGDRLKIAAENLRRENVP